MTRKLNLREFTDRRTKDLLRATNGLWASRLVCTITLVVISLYHLLQCGFIHRYMECPFAFTLGFI